MKFNSNIIALVIISLVILSCSHKSKSKLKAREETKGSTVDLKWNCQDENNSKTKKDTWVVMDYKKAQDASSGIVFRDYYSRDTASKCPHATVLKKKDGQYYYFTSFRDLSKAYVQKTGVLSMRQFNFRVKGYNWQVFMMRKAFATIGWEDLKNMMDNINNNKDEYNRLFRKYKWNLFYNKIDAESKQ